MEVERERRFQDQTELFYQLVKGGQTDLKQLDDLFTGTQSDQTRAYAIAGALVHDLVRSYGPGAFREILNRVHREVPFDTAFADVTGVSPLAAESEFWRRQRIWTSWIPVLTSSATLWLAVTLLAILAIVMRRRRNRQMERQWEKEEESDLEDFK
jgi:hypothetical protein